MSIMGKTNFKIDNPALVLHDYIFPLYIVRKWFCQREIKP